MRYALIGAVFALAVSCGSGSAGTSEPVFPDKTAPCEGLKTAPSGTTAILTRLTAVYETCDGTSALNYVKGKVSIVGYAGNGRETIVGTDYASGQVVNGWIIP